MSTFNKIFCVLDNWIVYLIKNNISNEKLQVGSGGLGGGLFLNNYIVRLYSETCALKPPLGPTKKVQIYRNVDLCSY